MNFQISALPISLFKDLFELDEAALSVRSITRLVADGRPAYPCRVSLQDALEGDELLLLPHAHHVVDTPYRASGPIYGRRLAVQAMPCRDEVPELLRGRLLSLRAYDASGMMQAALAVQGTELEAALAKLFALPAVSYLHVHYAQPGCYACRVDRGWSS